MHIMSVVHQPTTSKKKVKFGLLAFHRFANEETNFAPLGHTTHASQIAKHQRVSAFPACKV